MVVWIYPPHFSLLPAQSNISATVFCQISFKSLNVWFYFYDPNCNYISFYLFQFHPLIQSNYIKELQFGPCAFNFVFWPEILNSFWYQSFELFQFYPSKQICHQSLIILVSKFDFFQFYSSMQINYIFKFHFGPNSFHIIIWK